MNFRTGNILGNPGAVSGGGKKSKIKRVRKKFGQRKVKNVLHVLDFSLDFFPAPPTAPGSLRMNQKPFCGNLTESLINLEINQ